MSLKKRFLSNAYLAYLRQGAAVRLEAISAASQQPWYKLLLFLRALQRATTRHATGRRVVAGAIEAFSIFR